MDPEVLATIGKGGVLLGAVSRHLGIDAGSVSVKAVIVDSRGTLLESRYQRHYGQPLPVLKTLLESLGPADTVSLTGSAAASIAERFGARPVNEMVAQATACLKLLPQVRTIIEMGGEDSKLIVLGNGQILDFAMNAMCAAGTGSFLDQQAERLCMNIEEFSRTALLSRNPPRIAGRCSVFAKSDMIHLQQIATPVEDIVAGLCFAVARNFRSAICKGKSVDGPVAFQGGVAANAGMMRAFREIFGLEEIIRPEHYALMGAIGAVLYELEQSRRRDLKSLAAYDPGFLEASAVSSSSGGCHGPLVEDEKDFWARHSVVEAVEDVIGPDRCKVYLGIDIGSISTNLAVIDGQGRLLSKRYLRTSGRPIEAVMTGLREIGLELGGRLEVAGVGTTGSGRYMIADYVGADIVKNEITAQATAAAHIDPHVDTIFEIGGQDSKYIGLKNGVVVDFEMNKACAAGTGSFLEEQAEKLSISIRDEFAREAFSSSQPCALGERCTVFMENSLMSRLHKGGEKRDLVAGLAYSIVKNYLNRVVGDRKTGRNVFFQGGTAFNKSVVAAFEGVLGQRITVPPHHDVTGAIGMALIALRNMRAQGNPQSRFRGFDLWRRKYEIKSFGCTGCDNVCEINTVSIEGEEQKLVYGGRCEKYEMKKGRGNDLPNLFQERNRWLSEAHESYQKAAKGSFRGRIGLPRIFFFHDFLPLWATVLWELGFQVVLSPDTNNRIIHAGLEAVSAETCFPVKVAHGHVKSLIEAGVDHTFMPSMIGLNTEDEMFSRGVGCPYTQTIPYLTTVALGKYPAIRPIVDLGMGRDSLIEELHKAFRPYGIRRRHIREALQKGLDSQNLFTRKVSERGREILKGLSHRAMVITGRAYNAFDAAMNLNIPKKLTDLGVLPIPMDFLPLNDADIRDEWSGMYWRSGQRLLQAARIVRENPRLFSIFITNFSCGPDSFVLKFFKEKLAGKPFLQLEIDEHSADAGAITRCEAFMDSLDNLESLVFDRPRPVKRALSGSQLRGRTIFIPKMCDHSRALGAAFRSCGINAECLPVSDASTTETGRRYVSGKECYPCTVTTGDMVKKATEPGFDPARSAFLMPSGIGPCRFGQYNAYHRMVLDELGFSDVPIFAPVQDAGFYRELGFVGQDFVKRVISGVVATDLLMKCLHETRPYERNAGETDAVYQRALVRLSEHLEAGTPDMEAFLSEVAREFEHVPRYQGRKPLVGVVGEIYVRSNAYSNEDLIRKIETLGGEVWLSPVSEWFFYLNFTGLRRAKSRKNWKAVLSEYLSWRYQARLEHRYVSRLNGNYRTLHEPDVRRIIQKAAPYVHASFEGEAILTIGKAVDLAQRGAAGLINAMPFGCMPGTIASAILKAVKEDHGVPYMNAAYDGTDSSTFSIQLETFMHQVGAGTET